MRSRLAPDEPVSTADLGGGAAAVVNRCRPGRHVFPPFKESSKYGGGYQACECGRISIDRSLGGGRIVEIEGFVT